MQNRNHPIVNPAIEMHNRLSRFFFFLRIVTVCCLFFSIPNLTLAQTPDSLPKLPALKNPRIQRVDIQHIALDLQFDFKKRQAIGSASITLELLESTKEITLDAGFLTITSVGLADTDKETPLEFTCPYTDFDDNLRILLTRTMAEGERITLHINYHTNYHNDSDPNNLWGSYGKGLRFFTPTTTEPRKRWQIWSMGEPHGNRYWFPGWDTPGDARTCELRLTVPKPLKAVAVGQLLTQTEHPDSTTTYHWKMDRPHCNHQTAFVVGTYQVLEQSFFLWQKQKFPLFEGGRPIVMHSYGYPDEMEAVTSTVERLPDMLSFFSGLTDHSYPYRQYNQVFVQDFPWGGGHHPGMSTISENMIDDYATHADFFYLWDGVEAQDLAAQWFGNLLVPADWSEVWLSKSFSLYLDCLYTEYKNGRDEMQLWNRNFQLSTCDADWQSGNRRPIVTRYYDNPATMCFDNFALRGALVLHTLRKELGEKKWLKAIRQFVRENAESVVGTTDLQQAVTDAAGRPMDWFFEQWVYTVGQPSFLVSKSYDAAKHKVTLTVRQVQQPDSACLFPQTKYFQGKIEVEIDQRIVQIQLEPRAENVFVFAASTEPRWINFDYGSAWMKTLQFEKSLDEWINQLLFSRDVLARRSAMIELAGIYKKENEPAVTKIRILDALRTVISSGSYWRLRYSAILTLQGLLGGQALDETTETLLLHIIKTEKSWNKAAALTFLGSTQEPRYADIYLACFNDESERVVNAAANALGKCKAPGSYEALIKLKDKPSWKNQSLISALNGLRELGDPRGAELALEALRDNDAAARWTLATPIWDFRLAAAETLRALGRAGEAYPIVYQRFVKAMEENDVNDIFSNVLLLTTLGDARGLEVFAVLREKFKADANALGAIDAFEQQLQAAVK